MFWIFRIQFLPNLTDHVAHSSPTIFSWLLPYCFIDLFLCKNPSGMLRQIIKCKELIMAQRNWHSILTYRLLLYTNFQTWERQYITILLL